MITYQILPTYSLRQCIELSLENLFVAVKTYVLSAHVEYSVESYFSKTNAGDTAGDRYTAPVTQRPELLKSFPCMEALTMP